MRRIVILVAALFSAYMFPQNTEPKLEKAGKLMKATYYHDNGEIAQTGFFMKGKLHGQWFMYDESGSKIASGKYVEGQREGKWFFWEDAILKEVDFSANKIVKVKNWNQSELVSIN